MSRSELSEVLNLRREAILLLARRFGASNVRVFGSLARGQADTESDIDFLVEMQPNHSLLDRIALALELEALLGCKVDVATERVLKPHIREQVLREAVAL